MSSPESKPPLYGHLLELIRSFPKIFNPKIAQQWRMLSVRVANYEQNNKMSGKDSKEMIELGKVVKAARTEKELKIYELAKILEMADPFPLLLLEEGLLIPADARPLSETALKSLAQIKTEN